MSPRSLTVRRTRSRSWCRGVRKIFGAHEIAASHLGWIESEIARDEIDHALGHGGSNRMSDGAVLRGDDLVLRHDAERRVVMPQGR